MLLQMLLTIISACFLLLLKLIAEQVTPVPLSYHLLVTLIFSGIQLFRTLGMLHTHKYSGFQFQPPVAH